jgi:hypothetical protein
MSAATETPAPAVDELEAAARGRLSRARERKDETDV